MKKVNRMLSVFALVAPWWPPAFHSPPKWLRTPHRSSRDRRPIPARRRIPSKTARGFCGSPPTSRCPIRRPRPGAWSIEGQHLHAGRLQDQGGGEKREVTVPAYIHDIAKVQVYCAWAEVLLGDASFTSPSAREFFFPRSGTWPRAGPVSLLFLIEIKPERKL